MNGWRWLALAVLGLALAACAPAKPTPHTITTGNGVVWNLVWSDEFDYTGLPDLDRWGYEVGYIRNNEKQYYTEARKENARVGDGVLTITARKEAPEDQEAFEGSEYTSASLHTRDTATWTYGRIEVRAKLPSGTGMWPAIWMLGMNIEEVGWPECGEIDIMENVGFDPDKIHFNIHTLAYNHMSGTNKGAIVPLQNPDEDFHVYAIEWFEDHLDFYLDDHLSFTFKNEGAGTAVWPYDQPFYLILNAAIGGSWGGQRGVDDTIFPQDYQIDYVRVYQQP